MRTLGKLCVVAVALAASPTLVFGSRPRLAVLPTQIDVKIRDEVPDIIDDYVLTAVQDLDLFEVIGQDDINAVLGFERQKELMACEDTACFAAIGGALGVQKLVAVKVAWVGGKWATSAKLIDIQNDPRVEERSTDFFGGDVAALLAAMPLLVRKLFSGGGAASAAGASPVGSSTSTPAGNIRPEQECGDATSCYEVGDDYYYGRNGRQEDFPAAAAFYERSCDLGNVVGCNDFGFLHSEGKGVPKDYLKAAKYYGIGCEAGYSNSCRGLAQLYDYGRGLQTDDGRAVELYEKACELGNAAGCNDAGVMHKTGEGPLPQDLPRAVAFYAKACDGGSALGCANLGVMYEEGSGIGEDWDRAMDLYKRACEAQDENGCNRLQALQPRFKSRGCRAAALGPWFLAAVVPWWGRRRRCRRGG